MITSFQSQNTGRFYPFDETELPSGLSDTDLRVLKRGIVDLGIVVLSDDDFRKEVRAVCTLTKKGSDCEFVIKAECYDAAYTLTIKSEPPAPGESADFKTYYGLDEYESVMSDAKFHIYGFITLGFAEVLASCLTEIKDIPIYRDCIKWVNRRHLRSVAVSNEDRWLPATKDCDDSMSEIKDRRAIWQQCVISRGDIVLKAGYNCSLVFLPGENKVQIGSVPFAGNGEVAVALALGKDEPALESGRFDTLISRAGGAKAVSGAYGETVRLSHDTNFSSKVETDNRKGCPKDTLIIEYTRKNLRDCN